MAGHSRWANIQHRKGRQDERRGRVWTRIIREIIVAARDGGADTNTNPRLRLAVDKAKTVNIPADTIKRNIDKATGALAGVSYEETRYEGYGVGGVAVMVDAMTDNKMRTLAEVRHILNKNGGNLGTDGSVAFQFRRCGQFIFAPDCDEEKLMEAALEAEAEDVIVADDGSFEVLSLPADFDRVKTALQATGLMPELAEITMRADNTVSLHGEEALRMQKLLDALEEQDDVQIVYHNAELSD